MMEKTNRQEKKMKKRIREIDITIEQMRKWRHNLDMERLELTKSLEKNGR